MVRFLVKLMKIIFILAIWAAAGAGAAYYFGSQPDVTYYPDGKTKSSVSRKWFIPNGLASFYRPDGTLSQQCTYINGEKTGDATIYFAGQPVKTRYQKGVLTGSVNLDGIALLKDKPVPSVTFLPQRALDISFKQDTMRLNAKAERTCADDTFIARLQSYADSLDKSQLKLVLECLKFQNLSFIQDETSCHLQGSYLYPAVTGDISLSCDMPYNSENLLADIEILSLQGTYILDQDNLSLDILAPQKAENKFFISYRGIAPIIRQISETLLSDKKEEYLPRILTSVLENLTSSDAYFMLNNQKVWDITGEFNLMNGFSDPYYISSYMDQQVTSQWKVSASGVNLKVLYPVSKKPMFLIGLNIDESFKKNYHALMQNVVQSLSDSVNSNSEDNNQTAQILANMASYADDVSNLLKNAYMTLYNNKGQKVLSGIINLKKAEDEQTILASPLTAFTGHVTLYENNKPAHEIVGDFEQGFMVDGKPAPQQEVFELIGSPTVFNVLTDIGDELDAKFGPIVDNGQLFDSATPVDPFLFGLYLGYTHAKVDPNIALLRGQVENLASGIQSLYSDSESYAGLNEELAIEYNTVPFEMLNDNDNLIHNVYGGTVSITIDAASSDGYDDEAFILTLTNLPQETCIALASHDWLSENDGFIGVAAAPVGTADVSLAYLDQPLENRAPGTAYARADAKKVCGQTGTSSVALKFY